MQTEHDDRPGDATASPSAAVAATAAGAVERIVVDAHVHFYPCFQRDAFLDAAWANLAAAAGTPAFRGALLLTETARDDWMGDLRAEAEGQAGGGTGRWRVSGTAEPAAVTLQGPDERALYVVAGRQIVTAEDLEVLALGTCDRFDDGQPLDQVLAAVARTDALAVVPWGFGKWFGSRGDTLKAALERVGAKDLWLGDNAGRPTFWPEPRHFTLGSTRGMAVLPGSDPLPMASEMGRAGRAGFSLAGLFDEARPWTSIKRALLAPDASPERWGQRESAWRFARNQIAMQLHKRMRRGASPA